MVEMLPVTVAVPYPYLNHPQIYGSVLKKTKNVKTLI
jgi:hypothetical protein